MYIEAKFFLSVACKISSSTCPSTESGMGCFDMKPRSLLRTSSRTPAGVSGTLAWLRRWGCFFSSVTQSIKVMRNIITHSFPDKIRSRVMQEGFEDSHQCIFILAQEAQSDLASPTERACIAIPYLVACFKPVSTWTTYHCIRKRRKHQSYSVSGGKERPRASQTFDPACDERLRKSPWFFMTRVPYRKDN